MNRVNRKPITVLLTCGGGPGTLAHGIGLKNSKRYDVRVVMADANPAAGNLFLPWVDARYQIPSYLDADFIPALLRLIEREDVRVLYSGLDEEIPIVARNREVLENAGCAVLLPSAESLEHALDKEETHRRLLKQVRMPGTWLLSDIEDADSIFKKLDGRIILKASASRGGRHIYMPETLDELRFYLELARRLENSSSLRFLIQEYIPGIEFNVTCLHDNEGKMIYAVCRRKFETRKIKSCTIASVIERREDVVAMALDSIKCLDLMPGFNNVEIIVSELDGLPYLIEVNGGRTAAQDMNLVEADLNFPEMLIDIIEGAAVEPVEHPNDGLAILKIRSDVIVNIADVNNILIA